MKKPRLVKSKKKANGHANPAPAREISSLDAARLLGCSDDTVCRLLIAGELQGWRLNDRGWWRVDLGSVREYLRRRGAPRWRQA